MSNSTAIKQLYLLNAVEGKDVKEIKNLLGMYTYTNDFLLQLLIRALKLGSRNVVDELANAINYNIGQAAFYFISTINAGYTNKAKENITNRLLDLAKHKDATIDYPAMQGIINNLTYTNDKYVAKFLDYFLNTQQATRQQIQQLMNIAGGKLANSKTANILKEHTPIKLL